MADNPFVVWGSLVVLLLFLLAVTAANIAWISIFHPFVTGPVRNYFWSVGNDAGIHDTRVVQACLIISIILLAVSTFNGLIKLLKADYKPHWSCNLLFCPLSFAQFGLLIYTITRAWQWWRLFEDINLQQPPDAIAKARAFAIWSVVNVVLLPALEVLFLVFGCVFGVAYLARDAARNGNVTEKGGRRTPRLTLDTSVGESRDVASTV